MIITEENFRFLVRSILLEGSYGSQKRSDLDYSKKWDELKVSTWLSSKVDEIEQVKIGDKYYFSFGFIEQGNVKGLGIKIPKADLPFVRKKLGLSTERIIDSNKPFKIVKPAKGEYTKHSEFGKSGSMVITIPSGAPNVILGTSVLDTGKTTTAEVTTQILDIIGGVPLIGEVADAGNAVVQLAMDPPRYFGAFLSVLGAIPTIGTVFAALKIAKNAGEIKDAVKAGKALNKAILDAVGEKSMRDLLKGKGILGIINQYKDEAIESLTRNADRLRDVIPNIDDIIVSFSKWLDKFSDAYRIYSNFKPVKFLKEVKAWQAFLLRAESRVAAAFHSEFKKGLESYFDIKMPTVNDIDTAIVQLIENTENKSLEEFTDEQIKFAYELSQKLEEYVPQKAKEISASA